jgi:hypothetical protein
MTMARRRTRRRRRRRWMRRMRSRMPTVALLVRWRFEQAASRWTLVPR